MNDRERLLRKLDGEATDRIPVICPGGMMNMVTRELMERCSIYLPEAHHNAEKMANLAEAVHREKVFENIGVPFCMTVECEMYGCPVDFGSDIFEPHIKEYIIKSSNEISKLKNFDINNGRVAKVIEAIKLLKSRNLDAPIIGNITGPVSVASSLMEPSIYFRELRRNNEAAHLLMKRITEDLTTYAIAMIDAGADVITIADPSGTGEILGPKLFKEFCVDYINRITEKIKDRGARSIVHICGQMKAVYKEVNLINTDALSFDSIVPVKVAKKELGGRTIMGNISTLTLEFGDEEQIQKMSQACINSGTDILSPACGLGMKTPLKNIKAMRTIE